MMTIHVTDHKVKNRHVHQVQKPPTGVVWCNVSNLIVKSLFFKSHDKENPGLALTMVQ